MLFKSRLEHSNPIFKLNIKNDLSGIHMRAPLIFLSD